jgi:hypothetical protein
VNVDLEHVFGDLATRPRWVAWRWENRNGKATKPPIHPGTGGYAKNNDPSTWGTLEDARYVVDERGLAGVGIVLGDGLGGIDLDACRDPETGEITPWAQQVVDEFATYTEVSPSGTGLKLWAFGAPTELPTNSIPMDTPPIQGKDPKIEVFVTGRYFCVTGEHLEGTPDEITDAGELGGPWDRIRARLGAPSTNGSGPERKVAEPTGTTELSDRLRAALDGDRKLRVLWTAGKAPGNDRSRNDAALAATLALKGFTDEEIEAAIRAYPLGQVHQEAGTRGYDTDRAVGRLLGLAQQARENRDEEGGVRLDDFRAYMPEHKYIFRPSRELWPASSVDARIPPIQEGKETLKASKWLDRHRPVEQMTWIPGKPEIIEDRLVSHGGWIERDGVRCFNLYRPPIIEPGDPGKADPWLEHGNRIFPDSFDHILRWLAHRVQKPDEKINHAIALIGPQGTGKDTLIEGVLPAVGTWNVWEVGPEALMGRFNPHIKSVILRVSEARDLGDTDRYRLYEHLKTLTAAPPHVLRVDEKNVREYMVPNVTGVVITSNHTDGIYLPADDRRHYVAATELTKDDFTEAYWTRLWGWYHREGFRHIAAYLHDLDLSDFNPKAPPPKTAAFWQVVDAGRAPEDAELADVLDRLQSPPAITLAELITAAEHMDSDFAEWLRDRRNRRKIPHRLEEAEYVPIRNDGAKDGRWKVGGKNQMIYARRELSVRDRIAAATRLVEGAR